MTRITKDFKQTVKARADSDPEFKAALLREVELLEKEGDTNTSKYVKMLMADDS